MLKIANTVSDSIVDGPGLRYTVFVQGCSHNCPGCHNPGTHDPEGGRYVQIADLIVEMLKNPLTEGLTISGGEPFEQVDASAKLACLAKHYNKSVWVYTGFKFESLLASNDPMVDLLLRFTDVLVDGPYIESQKSYELKFRGSKNQRLIDVQASLNKGEVVLFELPASNLEQFQVPDS